MIPERVTQFNLFADGVGKAGIVEEVTLPKVVAATEEFQGGGMASPVDLLTGSLEKMDADFTIKGIDAQTLKMFGIAEGRDAPLTFRGAIQGEAGQTKAMTISMRGVLKEVDLGAIKVKENTTKYSVNLRYFKLTLDGEEIYDIDVVANRVVIAGVDQAEQVRAALGL